MNRVLEDIQPKNVFRFFEDICNIPHGSGNVEKISRYLVDFAKERGLDYRQDENFNVVIRKPATKGSTGAPVLFRDIWIWLLLRHQTKIKIWKMKALTF